MNRDQLHQAFTKLGEVLAQLRAADQPVKVLHSGVQKRYDWPAAARVPGEGVP